MNNENEITIESIAQEAVLHAKIAQLSKIVLSLYQENCKLKEQILNNSDEKSIL